MDDVLEITGSQQVDSFGDDGQFFVLFPGLGVFDLFFREGTGT